MNYSKQFIRKIVYIVLIAALLLPLSFVGRPSTRDKDDKVADSGGILSQLRYENDLSQTSLSKIDPASETMKLGSLGLRGLAVSILWYQVSEAKDKKQFDEMAATIDTLKKLQPNFIGFWTFQSHNLTYNVSIEFDDYQERYKWARNGIDYLTDGIAANKRDHRIQSTLGQMSGQKLSLISDEKIQYRRLFRTDKDFHERLSKFINILNLRTPEKNDTWLLAHEWYRQAENMVDNGVEGKEVKRHLTEPQFYEKKPAQVRNLMLSLQTEFQLEREYVSETWKRAFDELVEYGRRPMKSQSGLEYNLESEGIKLLEVERLRGELDKLAPGLRADLRKTTIEKATANGELGTRELELLNRKFDQLDDNELAILRGVETKLIRYTQNDELKIAEQASEQDRSEALRLARSIVEQLLKMQSIDYDRTTRNYPHWRNRTEAEATNEAILAHEAEYRASELKRKSILNSFLVIDPVTGDKELKDGAIQEYEKSYRHWANVLNAFPELKHGPLIDDLIESFYDYSAVRQQAGLVPWIADHPLQDIVDELVASHNENLYSSEMIQGILQAEASSKTQKYGLPNRPNIEFDFDE